MELWNLYDDKLINTNNTISSNDEIPDGYYHLALELWIINSHHEVLLLKNTLDYSKRYPGYWCCIGGNLCVNETNEEAIKRIIKEKIGISISPATIIVHEAIKRDPYKYAYMTCIIIDNIDINNIHFEDNNSLEAKFFDKDELLKMCSNGEIAYYLIDRIDKEVIRCIK